MLTKVERSHFGWKELKRVLSIAAMSSFSVAVPVPPKEVLLSQSQSQLHRDEDHNHEESAIDMEDLEYEVNDRQVKEKARAMSSSVSTMPSENRRLESAAAIELRPIPSHLSERARRPSAFRRETEETLKTIAGDADTLRKGDEEDVSSPPTRMGTSDDLPALNFTEAATQSRATGQLARKQRTTHMVHIAALYWCFFLEGWNDGSVGPLLPVIQRDYRVGFEIVALLFVTNFVGFVSGAFLNVWANQKFGFGKVMVFGALCQLIAYIIQSPAPPFPVLVMSFFFAGFGISLQNAQGNGFVGSVRNNEMKLMCLHASYGVGAFCSPLVATYFSGVRHWSFHYVISAGIAISNVAILISVFKLKRQEVLMVESGQKLMELAGSSHRTEGRSMYRQIFSIRALHFMAIFALIYIGVEVTVGGWIVTFIIQERGGGQSAGYISSGFFGGLTIGRLALWWINKKVGEYTVIFVYSILSIALEITVWFIPSIIENAVAVSFIGVALGPMFPLMVTHGARIIPASLFTGSMGWITGIGMAGSAALPFVTGVLAAKYGIRSLQPFLIAMMSVMLIMWAFVPKGRRAAV